MLSVVSQVCRVGVSANEDALRASSGYGIVIDGSTGLDGIHLTPGQTDAAWMSHRLADLLAQGFDADDDATASILKRCAATIRAELEEFGYREGMAYPTACVATVRETAAGLECYALGDCAIFVRLAEDGEAGGSSGAEGAEGAEGAAPRIVEVFDRSVPRRDARVYEHMRQIHEETGCSVREALLQVRDELRKNRSEQNTPGAYWVFEPTGAGVDHALVQVFDPAQVQRASLMSDGYMDAIDLFGLVESEQALVCRDDQAFAEELVERMHAIADADPDFDAFPRFKNMDDATVLCLQVER